MVVLGLSVNPRVGLNIVCGKGITCM